MTHDHRLCKKPPFHPADLLPRCVITVTLKSLLISDSDEKDTGRESKDRESSAVCERVRVHFVVSKGVDTQSDILPFKESQNQLIETTQYLTLHCVLYF